MGERATAQTRAKGRGSDSRAATTELIAEGGEGSAEHSVRDSAIGGSSFSF